MDATAGLFTYILVTLLSVRSQFCKEVCLICFNNKYTLLVFFYKEFGESNKISCSTLLLNALALFDVHI